MSTCSLLTIVGLIILGPLICEKVMACVNQNDNSDGSKTNKDNKSNIDIKCDCKGK